jgi:hypothetical protein
MKAYSDILYAMRGNLSRALAIALVVGTALLLINHGDHLEREPICSSFYLKCTMCYVVPFLVSMISAVLASKPRRAS